MPRVRHATVLDGHRLRLTLTNGRVVERDVGALLWGPVFEPLRREDARLRAVSVEAGTVAWPGGADIDPDVLIWGGPPPADPRERPPQFLRLGGREGAVR